jgi:hypothetical protein
MQQKIPKICEYFAKMINKDYIDEQSGNHINYYIIFTGT